MRHYNENIQSRDNSDQSNDNDVSKMYARVKDIYKCAERNGDVDEASIDEVKDLIRKFTGADEQGGVVFSLKALVIIYQAKSENANDLETERKFCEEAHDMINQAMLLAEKIGWDKPSIGKRQGVIKVRLADILHRLGEHQDANTLMRYGLRVLSETNKKHRDYVQGQVAFGEAQYVANYWYLKKLTHHLQRTEQLASRSTKPDDQREMRRINNLRKRISRQLEVH